MTLSLARANKRTGSTGFTLIEVIITFAIFGMVASGMIYGYVQANRMAEWSSSSLGAQSYALQGVEQARAAKWDTQVWSTNTGPGTGDELGLTNYYQIDTNDVPSTGAPILLTNYIYITQVGSGSPPLRQIRSDVVWTFSLTGKVYTNTVITLRAPDQ
jgi:prepilin-type N-terminal cleavage/methylation domain-containing protein